jgi:hypothetical protein
MIFSLEALQARYGDSLILHWGSKKTPSFLLIDGGPKGVYKDALSKRLGQLQKKFAKDDGRLDLEMVMVSHIDDDHISGIVSLFADLEKLKDAGKDLTYNVKTLWFNSFDETTGNLPAELKSKLASFDPSALNNVPKPSGISGAVLASVGQGRDLRASAERLGVVSNSPFKGLVMAAGTGKAPVVKLQDGLSLTILAPSKARLEALGEEWEKDVKNNPDREVLAAFVDKSVPNLSSIVVFAQTSEGTMLLCGDARGDDILAGLDAAKLLKGGKLHVDVFKFPHHGSSRDMTQEFLEKVTADQYVFSADGSFDNPDAETIEMLCKARGADAYTVYITNEKLRNSKKTGAAANIEAQVKKVFADNPSKKRKVIFRDAASLSVLAEIGKDKVTY